MERDSLAWKYFSHYRSIKPHLPLQDSLEDSLLNSPFNSNSKLQSKDINDQVQDDLKETIDRELRDRSQSVLVFIHRCWCDWSRTNWAQNNWLKSSTSTSLDHSWFPGLFVFRAAPWEQNSSWALQSIAINSKQSFKTCNMLSEELVTSCLPVIVPQPVVENTQS